MSIRPKNGVFYDGTAALNSGPTAFTNLIDAEEWIVGH
jgi:hypothetical protein